MKHKSLGFRGCLLQSESLFWHLSYPVCDTAHLKGDNYNEKQNFNCDFYHYALCPVDDPPLRTFDWALESPVAEIMVYSYAAFMIFSGIFSILSYTKGKVKSKLMQVCVVINSIYAVGAIAIIGMNIVTRIGG